MHLCYIMSTFHYFMCMHRLWCDDNKMLYAYDLMLGIDFFIVLYLYLRICAYCLIWCAFPSNVHFFHICMTLYSYCALRPSYNVVRFTSLYNVKKYFNAFYPKSVCKKQCRKITIEKIDKRLQYTHIFTCWFFTEVCIHNFSKF